MQPQDNKHGRSSPCQYEVTGSWPPNIVPQVSPCPTLERLVSPASNEEQREAKKFWNCANAEGSHDLMVSDAETTTDGYGGGIDKQHGIDSDKDKDRKTYASKVLGHNNRGSVGCEPKGFLEDEVIIMKDDIILDHDNCRRKGYGAAREETLRTSKKNLHSAELKLVVRNATYIAFNLEKKAKTHRKEVVTTKTHRKAAHQRLLITRPGLLLDLIRQSEYWKKGKQGTSQMLSLRRMSRLVLRKKSGETTLQDHLKFYDFLQSIRKKDTRLDQKALAAMARDFFMSLFTNDMRAMRNFPAHGRFPHVEPRDILRLVEPVTDEDVKRVVFDMGPLKTPGVDGFNVDFFHKKN
ncbi:hypothetical protein V6N12_064993 [Hibiscus sabdariffa]|uniref:Uncharacterized protein n=1 Tax=Hibiscus sabdariffa TaxID=183260 RepID=A0ABR2G7F1_9ROSI